MSADFVSHSLWGAGRHQQQSLAAAWLILGVFSLVGAGLFSLLLVLSRTPAISSWIPWVDFFHTALVVHVNLSVLVWFLAFAGVLWCLNTRPGWEAAGWLAWGCASMGALILVVVPFTGDGQPLMNNYVPVLQHPGFIAGLCVFAMGVGLQAVHTLIRPAIKRADLAPLTTESATRVAIIIAAGVTLIALLTIGLTYQQLSRAGLHGESYYEYLFWGGGHILQFNHTLFMLLAWLWLVQLAGQPLKLAPAWLLALLIFVVLPLLAVPFIVLKYEVVSSEYRQAFTDLMKYGGLASLPLGLVLVDRVMRLGKLPLELKPYKAALLASVGLFAVGGLLGFMIEGVNAVIPAHYHGSIVGVTLAFMGLSYYWLPYFGFPVVMHRMAYFQPFIYGGGQLLHIIGLAWSGGYGVQRKTAGLAQGLDRLPEIAGMALMGLGGLISIIGGLLFVIVALRALWGGVKRAHIE